MTVRLPESMLAAAGWGESWARWLAALPRMVDGLLDDWALRPQGSLMHGKCALVVPVVEESGRACVLKVAWPHDEGRDEHLMLQAAHGVALPMLFRADPKRGAMLMERLHAETDLRSVPVEDACELVAGLYRLLHRPALPQLRTLSSYVVDWLDEMAALDAAAPIPRRLRERAARDGRSFVDDAQTNVVTIHGDLHYENVLAADREPWLAIDPKPMAGDPHFEVAPLLFGRWQEALDTGNASRATRIRFETVVDAARLDEERAKSWALFRMVRSAARVLGRPEPLSDLDRSYVTRCITIAKVMAS